MSSCYSVTATICVSVLWFYTVVLAVVLNLLAFSLFCVCLELENSTGTICDILKFKLFEGRLEGSVG